MPFFKYSANDKYGLTFKGEMVADNVAEVIQRLKRNNILPITIRKIQPSMKKAIKRKGRLQEKKEQMHRLDKSSIDKSFTKRIKSITIRNVKKEDVITFTQGLYLLKRAGFNNIHALETLFEQTDNENVRIIIQDILDGVESGQNMYTIMEYYPDVFPPIYVGIIKSGELSGTLVNSLLQAREYIESSVRFKKKLRSILVPNIGQFVFLLIALIVGVLVAIPEVQKIYESVGLEDRIPASTKAFASFIVFMGSIWYIVVAVLLSVLVVLYIYFKTPEGKYKLDMFKYRVPIFGQLVAIIDLQKFLNALRLNLENGMRLQESIEISKEVIKNTVFLSVIETSKTNLIIGENWVEPIAQAGIFPNIVPEMLSIGMETDLTEMIEKIEEYVRDDIDRKIETTIKVLPEITYAFVGVMIVIFVVVIMVPIIEIYMGSFLFDAYL